MTKNSLLLCTVISGCPSIHDGASAGIIYSPGFPWNYPNNVQCNWDLTPPIGQQINLKFSAFQLKRSINCSDDVEVSGLSCCRKELLCGTQFNFSSSSYSSSGSMRIRFNSASESKNSSATLFLAFYQTRFSRSDRSIFKPRSKLFICPLF